MDKHHIRAQLSIYLWQYATLHNGE